MNTTVGIMSMQRIYNYGSSLQAYGLRRLVESLDPGAKVSYLEYRPGPTLVPSAQPLSPAMRSMAKVREYGQTKAPLTDKLRFFRHKGRYGRRYLPMLGLDDAPAAHPLSLQLIGSDEVFNCVQDNTNVGYSRDLFGQPRQGHMLASYAASFGNTTLEKVRSAGIEDTLGEDLAAFDHLSVRDRNSSELVLALTGREPDIHVDPVLAYPFMNDEPRIPEQRQHHAPYLIVYGYSGRLSREENNDLRRYADAQGVQILSFGGVQECADRFIDCDPFELLAYFRDCVGVVTDTFHGTIFSVINQKPFCTIIRSSSGQGYGNEEKLGYLLDLLGLSERRLDVKGDLAETLAEPLDGSAVDLVLTKERLRSQRYLQRVLEAARRDGFVD
ncbi:polysaccharide pyruvyl transferase family protein [Serinicoccus marinus]|uniref:polysaccharide pyruvyl transferase family protein n=1 Tax=Serinicoccus marinus TaxID=247333 RepID=UPI00248FCA13|nr:polysaccharide pyruvyl transferase family protein [Serinicoccus marinus]